MLEIIDEEADRLNGFIEGMVGLAQIESNAMHLQRSWTTIQDLFNTALSRASGILDTNYVLIEIDREPPSIFVDARSISEVLFLLLDNAAKYSPKGSKIKLAAHQLSDGLIQISVEDQGKGIPEDAREKVFQKFVRLEESPGPASSAGMGLGLAIAKGVVESQSGTIRIENGTNGYVTRFVLDLPIEEVEA